MASNIPHKPKKTEPGLGALPRVDSAEVNLVRDGSRRDGVSPGSTGARRLRDTLRREDDDDGASPPPPPSSRREAPPSGRSAANANADGASGKAVERSPRPSPVTVDRFGDSAMKLARAQKNVPRCIAAKVAIEKAPLDARSAFILSLVDGSNSVESLVDMSGMSETDVNQILSRLARLGLVALP